MKTPAYSKPLVIPVGASSVRIGSIAHCCGTIRVEGWIHAANKIEAFAADHAVAAYIGRKHLGAICLDQPIPVSCPFSFDVAFEHVAPSYRREEKAEAVDRVTRQLRRTRLHFAKLNRSAA